MTETKKCSNCGEEVAIYGVLYGGNLDQKIFCPHCFAHAGLKEAEKMEKKLIGNGELCRFVIHGEVCPDFACAKIVKENGLCQKHLEMKCSIPDCKNHVTHECREFADDSPDADYCRNPLCDEHAFCSKHFT